MPTLVLETVTSNKVMKVLAHNVVLSAGDKVKAEFGVDELDVVVPAGKTWALHVNFYIKETNS